MYYKTQFIKKFVILVFPKQYDMFYMTYFEKRKKFEKMVPAGIEPATLAFLFSISTMHYRLCYGAFQLYGFVVVFIIFCLIFLSIKNNKKIAFF